MAYLSRNHLRAGVCLLLFLWPGATAWPQGEVVFNNRVFNAVVAPVYGPEPANPGLVKQGNTAEGTPPGTQTYSGAFLAGGGFTAQFFGGPTNAAEEDLRPLLPRTTFQTGGLAGFVVAPPNAINVGDVPPGEKAKLQLRCWDNQGGTITNWLQVVADPTIASGKSWPFISPPLGGSYLAPANPIGLESFNLATGAVPAMRIRINFQTNGTTVPSGYLPDYGLVFGDRGNGFTYGWSVDSPTRACLRASTNSPDPRYDSFMLMDASGGAYWEIAVTNGAYRAHVAAGDPLNRDAVYRIEVEDVLVVNGTPVAGNNWVEGSAVVAVTDGKLTVRSAEGGFSNRLCFLDITPINAPQMLPPTPEDFSSNGFHLTFQGDPAVNYQIESTADFSSWAASDVPGGATSNLFSYIAPVGTNVQQQFYRAKVVTASSGILLYSNDFEGVVGAEWSATGTDLTPTGGRRFLGRFGQTTIKLSLTNLLTHTRLKIAFDLYVIQGWDGNSFTNGPDTWELNVTGGPVLLKSTFHAETTNTTARQAYPGPFPGSAFLPRTGAKENNALGYSPDGDSVYHLSYTFPHLTNFVEFNFVGGTSESLTNESWGLDNVAVYGENNPY